MTPSEARAELVSMVAATEVPVLTDQEVDRLLAKARAADRSGRLYGEDTAWAASTVYTLGQVVVPTDRDGTAWVVTAAGTSGATEPAWAAGVVDGTVTWGLSTTAAWEPTWRLSRAATEGWRWKAAKVAGAYDFGAEGSSFSRSAMHRMCLEMAAEHAKKVHGSLVIRGSGVTG